MKHKALAVSLMAEQPISKYADGALRGVRLIEGVRFCRVFLGFGAMGRAAFSASLSTEAFLCADGKEEPLCYYVFDLAPDAEALPDYIKKYPQLSAEQYLPLPKAPLVRSFQADVTDVAFPEKLIGLLREEAFYHTQILISLGDRSKERRVALQLLSLLQRENMLDRVSTVVREGVSVQGTVELCDGGALGDMEEMALRRHIAYDVLWSDKELDAAFSGKNGAKEGAKMLGEVVERAKKGFDTLSETKKYSNIFAVLSLFFKLRLLGLTLKKGKGGISEAQYLSLYQGGFPIERAEPKPYAWGVVSYGLDFPESVRTDFARMEHARWNGYMIACGYLPATLTEMRTLPKMGQSEELRRHGNLTTYEGLIAFRKLAAEVKGVSEKQADVICYDFQLMDDLFALLSGSDYCIT